MKRLYHLGLLKDYRNKHRVILQARQYKDDLDCELWRYLGVFITTKKELKEMKFQFLEQINATMNTTYIRLIID